MTKLGRNEPCWCNSGLKYKHCHLNRAGEPRVTTQEKVEASQRTFGKKYCIHPKAGNECSGNIVKAHTIQRKGFGLTRIARNERVYRFGYYGPQNGRLFGAELVPIKTASTFTGFCGFHDNSTFREIEVNPLVAKEEHAFLLGYRIIAHETFLKRADKEHIAFLRTLDRGKDLATQKQIQQRADEWEKGVVAGLKELEHHKVFYDKALVGSDFSNVHYYILELDRIPDFMCSGAVQPDYDFDGNLLQDWLNLTSCLDHITFSLIATDKGGAAVFSWCGKNEASENLMRSFDSMKDDELPHALTRYVFESFENVYASPTWWEGLDKADQEKLLARLRSNFEKSRASAYLKDDGQRVATWKVTDRKTNLSLQ
jgi:hypothetical protein